MKVIRPVFGLVGSFVIGFILLTLLSCAGSVRSPIPYAVGTPPVNDSVLVRWLEEATLAGTGTLTKVWHADQYEPLGFMQFYREAYIGRIVFDTLVKGKAKQAEVAYFAPKGNGIPVAGQYAFWIVRFRSILPLKLCSEHGLTEYGCQALKDYRYALDSDSDVLPAGVLDRARRLVRRAH